MSSSGSPKRRAPDEGNQVTEEKQMPKPGYIEYIPVCSLRTQFYTTPCIRQDMHAYVLRGI